MTMAMTLTKDPQTGATRYDLKSAGTFEMPGLEDVDTASIAAVAFAVAADSLANLADKSSEILNDADLSQQGHEKKLDPLQKDVVLTLARADAQLDLEEAHFDKRERQLYQVPPAELGHSADDHEIRGWWRFLPTDERPKMLQRMAEEPGHERLMLALLRSPIPQLDHEIKFVTELWRKSRRLDNPGEALAIDAGRANIAWGRSGVAHVAGLTRTALGWDSDRVVRTLLSSADPSHHDASKVFGIDRHQVEVTKRSMAYEAQKRY